ncbi:MAG: hypothetical protein F4Y79_04955 [Gemmatimonadetes bacterium]|nr:hypothetical protein [Gemmatimonadota bacterium]
MNETTELRDRQSQHAERLIRLETLIEQNQERVNRYEEDQRSFVNRYEEDQRSFVSRYEEDQREARNWQKWTVTLMCGSWITLMAAILLK